MGVIWLVVNVTAEKEILKCTPTSTTALSASGMCGSVRMTRWALSLQPTLRPIQRCTSSFIIATPPSPPQFNSAVAPFQDWMELGWLEIYDDEKLGGQGARALRDIHLPASKSKEAPRDVAASISVVAADLHRCSPEFVLSRNTTGDADPTYRCSWIGSECSILGGIGLARSIISPDRLCNLRLTSSGKLVQVKPIAAGDALTFGYDVDYWVYRLSELELSEWSAGSSITASRGMVDWFRRMHKVLNYSDLLRQIWYSVAPLCGRN